MVQSALWKIFKEQLIQIKIVSLHLDNDTVDE